MSNNEKLTPVTITFLVIAVALWGWAFPLIKISLDYIPPLVIGYFRYFFASLPFIFYLLYYNGLKNIKEDLINYWQVILALGLTMVTLPNLTRINQYCCSGVHGHNRYYNSKRI
jgi:drug/metabolite transporter (DMT)-like permease